MADEFEEFCLAFANAIEIDNDGIRLSFDTSLESLDEWDSLGKFSFLALIYSKYDANLDAKEVKAARTVGDLWGLVEAQKSH